MVRHEDEDVLSALLDGRLERAESERAQAHLAACPQCRRVHAGMKSAKLYLRMAPRRTMPAGLAADLQRRVDAPAAPVWRLPSFDWPRLIVPSLAFATAVFCVGLWAWDRALTPPPQVSIQALLAAHERYRDEGMLAAVDPAQADFASTLAAYDTEPNGDL